MKISIIGAGAWGQALAYSFCLQSHFYISLWDKSANTQLHPSFTLLENQPKLRKKVESLFPTDILLFVTPSSAVLSALDVLKPFYEEQAIKPAIIIASKGFAPSSSKHLMLSENIYDKITPSNFAVLSGPSFANEVFAKKPTLITFATQNKEWAQQFIQKAQLPHFQFQYSSDIMGTQICGAMKNLYAIGSGFLQRAEAAENTIARYMVLAINEIHKTLLAFDCQTETLLTSAGIGDFILTCTSQQSRNFAFGYHLYNNISSPTDSLKEGIKVLQSLKNIQKTKQITLPLADILCAYLTEKITSDEALKRLFYEGLE